MATTTSPMEPIKIPSIPSGTVKEFIPHLAKQPNASITEILEPYKAFESELRRVFAQQPTHEAVKDGTVNLVPLFAGHEQQVTIRARQLDAETEEQKAKYIMSLNDEDRKPNGTPAIVTSLKEFQQNLNLFCESSLVDLDWSNVVAAGSAVTTSLLPVPEKWAESKRSRREYYHEHLAPASDVDLFLYGLNEEQAREKIVQIEKSIKDSILYETTTIRTKNAITIASQHPTRHVQIVLRLYDSISQIITGFDVDCACVAYDGKQVYAAPRAIAAFVTQCNTIDLTRRSPSYENRLSKYSHRGFEVYWPLLDRSQIDPTIFERSFGRTLGLARLLILERLPKTVDREIYQDQRRAERGRPPIIRPYRGSSSGNLKDDAEDEVAEWIGEQDVSSYHTMIVPYGPNYRASKINRLLYAKDLLLNAEWNQPDDRKVYLHRHPCFFGTAEEVLEDCCGACPVPKTDEELDIAEEENKIFISGPLKFITDDPGRQEIGSFNPITDDEWTTMAYIGDTARLCQAIVDGDLEHVQDWCSQEGVDVNRRDFTGRTPLHLATMASTPEIVQCLIDHGARLIARLVDGRTALHIAAARGNATMVKALMNKSLSNEEEEAKNEDARKAARKAERAAAGKPEEAEKKDKVEGKNEDEDEEMDEDDEIDEDDEMDSEPEEIENGSEEGTDSVTMGSFVKVEKGKPSQEEEDKVLQDSPDEPDFYDVNVIAWDYGLSPLHLAILNGHLDVIKLLVSEYGADVLLPVKLATPQQHKNPIMTILLAFLLPTEQAKAVVKLLLELGATSAQADPNRFTVFHYVVAQNDQDILDLLIENDRPAALSVLNNLGSVSNAVQSESPLNTAVRKGGQDMVEKLLSLGAKPVLDFDDWIKPYLEFNKYYRNQSHEEAVTRFQNSINQPIILAAGNEMGKSIEDLLAHGADPSTLEKGAYDYIAHPTGQRYRPQLPQALLDIVQRKLKALREYRRPVPLVVSKPETLREEPFYTAGFPEGTYKYWSAQQNYLAQKKMNARQLKMWEEDSKVKVQVGIEEKEAAIARLIRELEKAEKAIIDAGGKTFVDIHPDLDKSRAENQGDTFPPTKPVPYETKLGFSTADLNDAKKEGYFRLFEAAWKGDLETIKTLTLAPWPSPQDNTLINPLKIAVQDTAGFSPFSIAVLRGHFELSKQVLEICKLQYRKEEGAKKRWTTTAEDLDSDMEDSDEEMEDTSENSLPLIYEELANDKYTTEILGEVSTIVKSDVRPLGMIEWPCAAPRILDNPPEDRDPTFEINGIFGRYNSIRMERKLSLMQHAISTNDMRLFNFIVKLQEEQSEEDIQNVLRNNQLYFQEAVEQGRTEMIAELIKTYGVGIPLNELVKNSGVEIKTKAKYYQGLSVGGKKKSEWARPPDSVGPVPEDKTPPLIQAAYNGSLDSVEWFMSDAPMRRYREFAENHRKDQSVRALAKSEMGFEKSIGKWLNTNAELILHCAILSPIGEPTESNPAYLSLLKHITTVYPSTLTQKSSEGWTPLHIAIYANRPVAAKHLISLGASQRSRDKAGRNMLHSMLVNQSESTPQYDIKKLREMIELFDRDALKEMSVERCTLNPGALTPLAYWMASNSSISSKPDIIQLLTSYGTGEELEMINGEGDLPLHVAIKQNLGEITEHLLSLNPSLLYRESATGRTPLEMARDTRLTKFIETPIVVPSGDIFFAHSQGMDPRALVDRAASEFVKKDSKKRTWEVCFEVDGKLAKDVGMGGEGTKRRLVSLFEANEVARRIQAKSKKGRENGRWGGVQVVVNGGLLDEVGKKDLVSSWMWRY